MENINIQKIMNDADVRMPAGKYAGRSIEEVPNDYLDWLLDNLDEEKSPKMISEIEKELKYRKKFNVNIVG